MSYLPIRRHRQLTLRPPLPVERSRLVHLALPLHRAIPLPRSSPQPIFPLPAHRAASPVRPHAARHRLLDIGCCFGQDERKLVADGAPPQNIYGADLHRGFIELDYDLFLDWEKLTSKFFTGDVLAAEPELKRARRRHARHHPRRLILPPVPARLADVHCPAPRAAPSPRARLAHPRPANQQRPPRHLQPWRRPKPAARHVPPRRAELARVVGGCGPGDGLRVEGRGCPGGHRRVHDEGGRAGVSVEGWGRSRDEV